MSAYNDFVRWYNNHIKLGGNIGTLEASTIYNIEDQAISHMTRHITFVRNNWHSINDNYDFFINDPSNFIENPTSEMCRHLIQYLWMADQEIHYKPVCYSQNSKNGHVIHPGGSRLHARWAQKKSTEIIFLDYKLPTCNNIYQPFSDVNEAWNGLTYTSHTPDIIETHSFKHTSSTDDLIDFTYKHDMDYYRTTDFEQILFIEDLKDDCYAAWRQSARHYLNECLDNPVRYGERMLNI